MTDQTPAPDPAPMSTPPPEDWATLHDRLLAAELEQARRRAEQAEAEQAELRTENEALRDKLAVRDHELEGLRDERDLHLAAFWQAVKQRDRALAQSAIDRPAADWAEAALDRVRALLARWAGDGPPPLGASIARWWDTRIRDLTTTLDSTEPTQEGTH